MCVSCWGYCEWNFTNTDECALKLHNCDANAICLDTQGSFLCFCQTGFAKGGPKRVCTNINECASKESR